ncbi:MAG TPA: hypothetical protein VE974_10560 [Thermoanaerobaculia bacterium]|nr:hypothetical protein [Thermoanaerobaculia bacterium]
MHKKSIYAMLLVLTMAFAATAAAQEDLYSVWKAAEGERGTLKNEEGTPVFTIEAEGPMLIIKVGRDYVEFARYTKQKGERRTHRTVPMERLVLRRSRLTP